MDRGAGQGFGPRRLSPQLYVLSTIRRPPARSDAGAMENTTILQISELRQNPVDRVLRRDLPQGCGGFVHSCGVHDHIIVFDWSRKFDRRFCGAPINHGGCIDSYHGQYFVGMGAKHRMAIEFD